MVMNVTLPKDSYAGWGWGHDMVNTEMIVFSANNAASTSYATTYFSRGEETPILDQKMQACYTTAIYEGGNDMIQFITTRPLDCNIADSYVVKLDKEMQLNSAWQNTYYLSFHDQNTN